MADDSAKCAIIGPPLPCRSPDWVQALHVIRVTSYLTILHFNFKPQADFREFRTRLTKPVKWAAAALLMLVPIIHAPAQGLPAGVTQKTTGELLTRRPGGGPVRFDLSPADHVVSGDQVVYTVEIRNTTHQAIAGIIAVTPIPEKMRYVGGSATGPGCEIDFSVDGGMSFDSPDHLTIPLPAGKSRPAGPGDYTHIRWRLQFALKGMATALARFRAVLK